MEINLKNLTVEQLNNLKIEVDKEKEFRLRQRQSEEWGKLLVAIQNYLNEFGDIEVSDLENTIVLDKINLTSPVVSSISIDYNY